MAKTTDKRSPSACDAGAGRQDADGGHCHKPQYSPTERKSQEGFSHRWGIPILDQGQTIIPNVFFDVYQEIGVSRSEFLVILHLARYRYECAGSESRPALKTVARQLGYSKRGLLNVLDGLEARGLLERHRRRGKTTVYDFTGFSRAAMEMGQAIRGEPQFTSEPQFTPTSEPQFTPTSEPQFTPGVNPSSPEQQETTRTNQEEKLNNNNSGDAAVDVLSPSELRSFQALRELGMEPESLAREYAQAHEHERVMGWCAYAKSRKRISNPAGYVRTQLDNGENPPTHPIRESFPKRGEDLDTLFDVDAQERHERYGGDTRGPLVDMVVSEELSE